MCVYILTLNNFLVAESPVLPESFFKMLILVVPIKAVTCDGPGNLTFLKSPKYKPHVAIRPHTPGATPARNRWHWLLEPGVGKLRPASHIHPSTYWYHAGCTEHRYNHLHTVHGCFCATPEVRSYNTGCMVRKAKVVPSALYRKWVPVFVQKEPGARLGWLRCMSEKKMTQIHFFLC